MTDKKGLMKQAKDMGVTFSYSDSAETIQDKINAHNLNIRTAEDVLKEEKAMKATQNDGLVYVACKLPNGIRFETSYGEVILKGVKMSELVKAGGFLPSGSYFITPVDRKAWNEIMKKYGDQPFIKNKIIFAKEDYGHAQGMAKEIDAEVVTGYEQVNPKKLRTKKHNIEE